MKTSHGTSEDRFGNRPFKMREFFSDLPPRELSQWDKQKNQWAAWQFDGINPVSEKYYGETRQDALSNLRNAMGTNII